MCSRLLGAMRINVLRSLHPRALILVMLWAAIGALFPAVSVASLVSAVLPASRSVQLGDTATVFATVINTGPGTATGCSISPVTSVSAQFLYQTTDPSTNALTGAANTPVDILEGAAQSFLFAFTPTAPFAPTEVELDFDCTNTSPAGSVSGLNTLLLSSSSTPVPDIIALSATSSGDGIVSLPSTVAPGAFATATVNVGATSTITVFADTGNASLPVVLSICETNPATGACLASPANSVTTTIAAGSTPTFSVFISPNGEVRLDPAINRVFVRFRDSGGVTRGSTSVALSAPSPSTQPPTGGQPSLLDLSGIWRGVRVLNPPYVFILPKHPTFPATCPWDVEISMDSTSGSASYTPIDPFFTPPICHSSSTVTFSYFVKDDPNYPGIGYYYLVDITVISSSDEILRSGSTYQYQLIYVSNPELFYPLNLSGQTDFQGFQLVPFADSWSKADTNVVN